LIATGLYRLSDEDELGFNDKWAGDEYESFIRRVVGMCASKLKPHGSLFFHISADRMFLPEKILRETFSNIQPIFWKRCRSKNNVKHKLGATIDVIFKCQSLQDAEIPFGPSIEGREVSTHIVQELRRPRSLFARASRHGT
jgi:hypothetical protein